MFHDSVLCLNIGVQRRLATQTVTFIVLREVELRRTFDAVNDELTRISHKFVNKNMV